MHYLKTFKMPYALQICKAEWSHNHFTQVMLCCGTWITNLSASANLKFFVAFGEIFLYRRDSHR